MVILGSAGRIAASIRRLISVIRANRIWLTLRKSRTAPGAAQPSFRGWPGHPRMDLPAQVSSLTDHRHIRVAEWELPLRRTNAFAPLFLRPRTPPPRGPLQT